MGISYWLDSTKETDYPKLEENINTDVCIIGAGITGIATAYMLRKFNLSVTMLEADKVCKGVTANTTAKLTSQHGLLYDYIINSFDKETARKYLKSNEEAIENIKEIIKREKIDCDLKDEDAYIYTCREEYVEEIKKEHEAVKSLGYDSEFITKTPLPFDIKAAIKFPNQASFHPRKYILGLLKSLEKSNIKIFENSKVNKINYKDNKYIVYCNGKEVNAKHVVFACHYPIKNFPGMYFLKMYQDTSYIIGIDPKQEIFEKGMFLSYDEPVTSFRKINDNLLLIGGSGHKTGVNNIDLDKSYLNLENYIKTIYPNAEVKYRWMTEDCVTLDKIPYIGEFSNLLPNCYVATGFKKWGMTTSHVAAKIIANKILKIPNEYSDIYTATRFAPIKNRKEMGNMLKQTSYSLVINKMKKPKIPYEEIQNDCGGVVKYNGKKVGIYKDASGKIYAVKPYCAHLGCELSWNNLEKTWDCPCHGSRYDYTGKIITEPTTKSLERIDI